MYDPKNFCDRCGGDFRCFKLIEINTGVRVCEDGNQCDNYRRAFEKIDLEARLARVRWELDRCNSAIDSLKGRQSEAKDFAGLLDYQNELRRSRADLVTRIERVGSPLSVNEELGGGDK